MDDNGHEEEAADDAIYRLTPKGLFAFLLMRLGATADNAEEQWAHFEAFCVRQARDNDSDSEFAALVFDGGGGVCIGVNAVETDN